MTLFFSLTRSFINVTLRTHNIEKYLILDGFEVILIYNDKKNHEGQPKPLPSGSGGTVVVLNQAVQLLRPYSQARI